MTFHLFIRDDVRSDQFVKHSRHDTYKLAAEIGHAAVGNANWFIEPSNKTYVPSREEQLLLDVKPKVTNRQLTVQLAMED